MTMSTPILASFVTPHFPFPRLADVLFSTLIAMRQHLTRPRRVLLPCTSLVAPIDTRYRCRSLWTANYLPEPASIPIVGTSPRVFMTPSYTLLVAGYSPTTPLSLNLTLSKQFVGHNIFLMFIGKSVLEGFPPLGDRLRYLRQGVISLFLNVTLRVWQ